MKVVLDTNVFISGVFFGNPSFTYFQYNSVSFIEY